MIGILVVATSFAAESRDFRSYLDQARFFLRKEWYPDALEELEKAVATEDGGIDPEAWFLLAKVRYELGDLSGARYAADRALVHSRDQDQARQAHELLSFLDQKFGYVQLEGPASGPGVRVSLTLESTLFDPDLKRWVNRVVETLQEPITLPHELGLPAARYAINGVEVEVVAGATQSVSLKPDRGAHPSKSLRLEVGLGGSGSLGARVSNLLPAPTTDLGVGLPIGPLAVGLTGSWSAQPYTTRDEEIVTSLAVFSVGARLGVEVPVARVDVRPSATWRLASVPGVEVGCASTAEVATWICERVATADEELFVYTAAAVHAVGLELAATTRPAPLGFGVKAAGELVLGALPRAGDAIGPDGPLEFTVTDPRGLSGGGWRLLALMQVRP